MVSGVTNRSQTWAESADDPLISEGKLIICGTAGIYLSALLATRHIPRAAEPGAGWTCGAGPAGQEPLGSRRAPLGHILRSRPVSDGAQRQPRCPCRARRRLPRAPVPSSVAGAVALPGALGRRPGGARGAASRPSVPRRGRAFPPGARERSTEPGGGAGPDGEQSLSPLLCLAPKFRSARFWTERGVYSVVVKKVREGAKGKTKSVFQRVRLPWLFWHLLMSRAKRNNESKTARCRGSSGLGGKTTGTGKENDGRGELPQTTMWRIKIKTREGRLGKVNFFCLAACPPSDTGSLLFRAKF